MTTDPDPLPDPDKINPDDPKKDVEEDLNPSIVPPND